MGTRGLQPPRTTDPPLRSPVPRPAPWRLSTRRDGQERRPKVTVRSGRTCTALALVHAERSPGRNRTLTARRPRFGTSSSCLLISRNHVVRRAIPHVFTDSSSARRHEARDRLSQPEPQTSDGIPRPPPACTSRCTRAFPTFTGNLLHAGRGRRTMTRLALSPLPRITAIRCLTSSRRTRLSGRCPNAGKTCAVEHGPVSGHGAVGAQVSREPGLGVGARYRWRYCLATAKRRRATSSELTASAALHDSMNAWSPDTYNKSILFIESVLT